jgi:glycosyltransferase involved in cell wall biosynthesis
MKIVAVYAEDYPWDVRVEKLLEGLAGNGFETHLVAKNTEGNPREETCGSILCHRILAPTAPSFLRGPGSLAAPINPVWRRAIRRVIAEVDPDVVIVRDLPLATLVIVEGHRAGKPVIVDMAENHPAMWETVIAADPFPLRSYILKNPSLGRFMERWVARNADAIFVVVDEMVEHLVECGASRDQITVVSNTPAINHVTGPIIKQHAEDRSIRLGYVGYVNHGRGLPEVVRILRPAREAGLNVIFHVVGSGNCMDKLAAIAAAEGVAEHVRFHGWVEHSLVDEFLVGSVNVGVVPHPPNDHVNTTIPNKIFDYMSIGLPVLTSEAIPLRRIVRTEKCGLSFLLGNVESALSCLRKMADPAYRAQAGHNGIDAIHRRYNWNIDFPRALEVVQRLVRGHTAHHVF